MFDPLKEYSRGLRGCFSDPRSDEVFADSVIRHGGDPDGDAVAHHWGFADLGKGKLTATWMHVEEQFPGCWPGPPQAVGDCFVAGTMVTMADGPGKPIEEVVVGDSVASPFFWRRKVTGTIRKPFTGGIHTIIASDGDGQYEITCTPDHLILSPTASGYEWIRAELLLPGTRVLAPTRRSATVTVVSNNVSDFSGDVYCIEVEEDHAFIANGLAVHNCVSHGCKNACLTTLACELAEGKPDEVTGLVEGKPDVPAEGIKQGVLSTEAIYWWRRDMMGPRSMDGWVCSDAAKHVTTNAGLWLRKPYEQFGFDLTKYSANNIRVFLGRNPPDNVRDYGRQYLIRTATNVRGREQVRDFLAAGYGVFFCSSLGWSSTRNEDGVSFTQGSWAHSQAAISFDERPETVRKYGEPLVGILNSWGRWNRGPRKVLGTDLQIPEGAYWTPASVLDRCSCIALSSVAGWPPRKLKSYGAKGRI